MWARSRQNVFAWLVVGPFAIVLAFPFYWMLMTSLKTNGDLYNVENVPFVFNEAEATPMERHPLKDQEWLPLGVENVTTSNYEFIFRDTKYVDWLQNTALIGLIVVLITLALALAGGLCARAALGRLGAERRRGDLPHLPRPADTAVPAPLAGGGRAGPAGPVVVAHPRLPLLHGPLLDLAPDGVLQDDPARARGRRDDRRRLAPEGSGACRLPDLAAQGS